MSTIIGKTLVVKTHGISNLIYSMSSQLPSQEILNKSQTVINSFLWNNKVPKIKHNTLINTVWAAEAAAV